MKIPRGQGMWPAFWMLGNDIGRSAGRTRGEIDVMENVGFEPSHRPRHDPRPRLLRLGRHRRRLHPARRPGLRRRLPHLRRRLVARTRSPGPWTATSTRRRTPADLGGSTLGVRQAVLPDPEPRGRRLLARRPGRQHRLPAAARRRLRAGDHQRRRPGGGGRSRGLGGKCVDVAGANSANGTAVQLYDCNGTAAQQWTVGSDGTIRALGKCLDVDRRRHRRRHAGPALGLQRLRRPAVDRHRAPATSSTRRPTSASTPPATARPTAPGCRSGPARARANQKWTRPPDPRAGSRRGPRHTGGYPAPGQACSGSSTGMSHDKQGRMGSMLI